MVAVFRGLKLYVIEERSLVCICLDRLLLALISYKVTVSMSATRQVSLLQPCILNMSSIDSCVWISGYPSGQHKLVVIAAHSWDNFP